MNILNFMNTHAKKAPPAPDALWQNPLYFIAFGLGTGAIPFAPGTFGTLLAIPFYLLLRPLPLAGYIAFVILFIIASAILCDYVSKQIAFHDHPGMNIDEFAGFFVTMIHAPHGFGWILLGFVLFRIFDILKPWPINFADQHIKGGFGIVFDDVLAGIYALIIMQIVRVYISA